MRRTLPSAAEAAAIFAARRTRPARRPPPPAGKALAPLIRALDARFGRGVEGLAARWSEIVGQVLARRSEPVKIVRGRSGGACVLEIRVDGPSAPIITHQAPAVLARVNLFLGNEGVDRLRIIQAPLRGGQVRAGGSRSGGARADAPRRRMRAPLDAAAERRLAETVEPLAHDRLRQAVERLGREVLRAPRN